MDQKIEKLLNYVRLMRGYQRSWAKFHLGKDRISAKKYESIVDRELSEILASQKETIQKNIFGQE